MTAAAPTPGGAMLDGPALRRRLAAAPLDALGLDPDDRDEVERAIARLDDDGAGRVAAAATRLLAGIGCADEQPASPFASLDDDAEAPAGTLATLALVATAADVAAWLRGRGVDARTAASGVADLGRQLRVHRSATGRPGLDTEDWLAMVWSGALLQHGALQVGHVRHPRLGWVRSVHIPAGAALSSDDVDASLAAAAAVGEAAFPERATAIVHCRSWMLDPWLVDALPGSRLADFAARWTATGSDADGTEDVLWFVFGMRPPAPPASTLPRDSTLRRAMAERLEGGGRPLLREGVLPA